MPDHATGDSAMRPPRVGRMAVGAVLLWVLFGALTWWVTTSPAETIDAQAAVRVHERALEAPWLVSLSVVLDLVGGVPFCAAVVAVVAVALVAGGGLGRPLSRPTFAAVVLVASAAGGAALNTMVKMVVDRPRPPWNGLWVWESTTSYPSGHAQAGITVWVALGLVALALVSAGRAWWVATPLLVLGPLIGMSRVVLGVHWPSDVVGGWLLGGAWLMTCLTVAALARSDASRAVGRVRPRP